MNSTLDAFYNTRSRLPGCCLAFTADALFTPVRYLFGGRNIVFRNHTDWCQTKDGNFCLVRGATIRVSERWQKPANKAARWALNFFAALVLIPCVVAGTVLKLVAHCNILTAASLQRRYRMAIRALAEQNPVEQEPGKLIQVDQTPAYIRTGENTVFLAYRVMGILRTEAESPPSENNPSQRIPIANLGDAWQHARYMAVPEHPVIFITQERATIDQISNSTPNPNYVVPELSCCTRLCDQFHFLWA